MKGIVCVDKNWCIGKDNELLFHIKEDMQHFKNVTSGQICVMGFKTLISLPNSSPLPNRTNIVLTSKDLQNKDIIVCHNLDQLFETILKCDKEVYVIGGASIYKELTPYCSEMIVSKVNKAAQGNVYIDNLDKSPNWQIIDRKVLTNEVDVVTYKNNNIKDYQINQ